MKKSILTIFQDVNLKWSCKRIIGIIGIAYILIINVLGLGETTLNYVITVSSFTSIGLGVAERKIKGKMNVSSDR